MKSVTNENHSMSSLAVAREFVFQWHTQQLKIDYFPSDLNSCVIVGIKINRRRRQFVFAVKFFEPHNNEFSSLVINWDSRVSV